MCAEQAQRPDIAGDGSTCPYTPEGTTDVTAPVDHHVGLTLKRKMQVEWKLELRMNYNYWTQGDPSMHGKHTLYRRILMVRWCFNAWRAVQGMPQLLLSAFVKTGFLSKMDGSDKHLLEVKGVADYDPDDPRWDVTQINLQERDLFTKSIYFIFD